MSRIFENALAELAGFEEMNRALNRGQGPVQISGCMDSQKVHLMQEAGEEQDWKLVVTAEEAGAKELYDDFRCFGDRVWLYPAKDLLFYSADIHGNLLTRQRMQVLKALIEEEEGGPEAPPAATAGNVPEAAAKSVSDGAAGNGSAAAAGRRRGGVVVTTIDGMMDHLLPLAALRAQILKVRPGETIDIGDWQKKLTALGYERVPQVDGMGQFSIRGGILDVYPLTEELPLRIELWDDEVDSIRSFDPESQRSVETLDHAVIYPATELVLTKEQTDAGLARLERSASAYETLLRGQMRTEEAHRVRTMAEEWKERIGEEAGAAGLDSLLGFFCRDTVPFCRYFPKERTAVFLDEPARLRERAETVETEFRESMISRLEKGYLLPEQTELLYSADETLAELLGSRTVMVTGLEQRLPGMPCRERFSIRATNVNSYQNSFEMLIADLKRWKRERYRVVLLSGSHTRASRLAGDLRDYELSAFYSDEPERRVLPGEIMVRCGNLHRGFEYPQIKFVVITEGDMFGAAGKKRRRKKVAYEGQRLQSFTELSPGDYVVHEEHGLGIYRGIEKIEQDRVVKDYLKIEYADGGYLYLPATRLDVIQKYAGAEAKAPKLNRLGGDQWKKTRDKVKGAVREIAQDLVKLYAARQERDGFVYSEDTVWQKEFEELFPYEETEDQLEAIEATNRDMQSKKIMERQICGDVGYGKTEIALRAAFKAVQDGRQVAYLVPTTILAQQHYNTFVQRMKDFPVRVDMLSRFRTPPEQMKTLEDLKKGLVDVVIGTHRLLSKDVQFKDLGLLIIDEEQRFGVSHKEKIKQMKQNVDVLTLTATPIPRTLHMSLAGIRDMSVLEEPPVDRVPIQTYVMEYNEEMVREAIQRELARGGQVFYVSNRVQNIPDVAARVARLVPDATVVYAHGQMNERQLERIMLDFVNGEIDVLVSTTIIETGIDIPNANTIIIQDADRMGLSQLYQLRGRVGRSSRTAYAFLMYRRDKVLREEAEKRLKAIREFTELGSGIRIAMRDLEIRGAGNVLGAEQHGHMEAVGYDLYCKLLNQAVMALKGERKEEEEFHAVVECDIDAYIPSSYIKNESQKLDIYKRISAIENEEESMDMQDELTDRFGEIPQPVNNLLLVARLRGMARRAYVTEVDIGRLEVRLTMFPRAKLDTSGIPELIRSYGGRLKMLPGEPPGFLYRENGKAQKDGREMMAAAEKLLKELGELAE